MKKITIISVICVSLICTSFISLPFIPNKISKKTYCFDDSYGSGNKFELSLIDGGKASIIIKNRNNEIIRSGSGTWSGTNDGPGGNPPTIRLNLSTGILRFTAIVDGYSSSINMLIDSQNNQWYVCEDYEVEKPNYSRNNNSPIVSKPVDKSIAWEKTYDTRKANRKFASLKSYIGSWENVSNKIKVVIKPLTGDQPLISMSNISNYIYQTSDKTTYEVPDDIFEKSLNFKRKENELVSLGGERTLIEVTVTSPEINFKGLVMERETFVTLNPNEPNRYQIIFYNKNKDRQLTFSINSLVNPSKGVISYFEQEPIQQVRDQNGVITSQQYWNPVSIGGEQSLTLNKKIIKKK